MSHHPAVGHDLVDHHACLLPHVVVGDDRVGHTNRVETIDHVDPTGQLAGIRRPSTTPASKLCWTSDMPSGVPIVTSKSTFLVPATETVIGDHRAEAVRHHHMRPTVDGLEVGAEPSSPRRGPCRWSRLVVNVWC